MVKKENSSDERNKGNKRTSAERKMKKQMTKVRV